MDDLISRHDAIAEFYGVKFDEGYCNEYENGYNDGIDFAVSRLFDMPSVKRKKGKWIWDENGMDWGLGAWCCSECGSKSETWWESDKRKNPLRCSGGRFCGNCGAEMKGIEND